MKILKSTTLKTTTMALAISAATLFLAAPSNANAGNRPATGEKPCYGVNACKGMGSCKSVKNNVCAGHNKCRGQSVVPMRPASCEQIGGIIGRGNR